MFKVYTVNGQEYEVSNEKESQFLQEFPNAELIEDTVSTPTETVTEGEVVSQPGMLPPSTQLASQGETPSNIVPAVRAEEGFWSELYQSVNQYWTAAGNTEETLDIAFGDVTEEDIEEYQKALIEEDARGGPTQSMLDFYKSMEDNGGGLVGGFKAFLEHPEVGVQQAVGSMAGLIRTGFDALGGEKTAGAIGAGTAAGAGIGAGIGAAGFVAGPFGAVTTTGGAIAGGTRGAYGSLSGLMEGTGKISELMREHLKGDYSTENIKKVLNDDAVMSDIRSKAIARGLTIAAVDGITGGLGKAVGTTTKTATGVAKAGKKLAQVGTEAVGGGVGEALAQQAAGEEYDAGAIVLEATSGPSTLPAEAGLSAVQRLRNAKKDGATRLEDSPKKEIKDGPSAYRINGQPLKKEAFLETINKMNPEDVKDANISVSNDPGVNKYISDIVRNVYENDGKKKPPSGGAGTTMDLKALDKESKRIQPAFMDNAQDKYIRKIGDLQHQLENVILEGAPPEIEESLREQIAYQENLLRKSKNEVNKEVYKLNPLEKTELNELKSQQRLYQSFINNERAPDEVKKIAKEKLNEIENKQLEVFFSPTIRSTQASQKAQQIFENEGVEAYNKIIDTQEGLIRQIAINKLNSVPQSQRRQGDVEALVSELKYGKEGAIGIIEKYDSTKIMD